MEIYFFMNQKENIWTTEKNFIYCYSDALKIKVQT